MRLLVNGRNIDITEPIRDYVNEKIGKVANQYNQINKIEVTLDVIKNPSVAENHVAEANCNLNGSVIHVKEQAESMYASIDLLEEKLSRQVKKIKEKTLGKSASGSIRTENYEVAEEEESEVESDLVNIDIVEE